MFFFGGGGSAAVKFLHFRETIFIVLINTYKHSKSIMLSSFVYNFFWMILRKKRKIWDKKSECTSSKSSLPSLGLFYFFLFLESDYQQSLKVFKWTNIFQTYLSKTRSIIKTILYTDDIENKSNLIADAKFNENVVLFSKKQTCCLLPSSRLLNSSFDRCTFNTIPLQVFIVFSKLLNRILQSTGINCFYSAVSLEKIFRQLLCPCDVLPLKQRTCDIHRLTYGIELTTINEVSFLLEEKKG